MASLDSRAHALSRRAPARHVHPRRLLQQLRGLLEYFEDRLVIGVLSVREERLSVKNSPTHFGTVAYEIVSDAANKFSGRMAIKRR